MDWQSFLSPWNIGGGLFGLLLGVAALVALVANRSQIGAALVKAAQRLFSPVGFFGLVIVVFMIISVLESDLWAARLRTGPWVRPGKRRMHAGTPQCHSYA